MNYENAVAVRDFLGAGYVLYLLHEGVYIVYKLAI